MRRGWVYTAQCWGWVCGCCQWPLRTCNLPDDNTTWQPRGQSPYNFLSPLWVIGGPWTCPSYKGGEEGEGKGDTRGAGGDRTRDSQQRHWERGDRVIKRKGRQRAGERKIKKTRAGRKRLISFTVGSLKVQQRQKKSVIQSCSSHIGGKWRDPSPPVCPPTTYSVIPFQISTMRNFKLYNQNNQLFQNENTC